MPTTKFDVRTFILHEATSDDLNEIIDNIKQRRSVLNAQASVTFNKNDRVYFDAGRRGIVKGIITGFTRSKVLLAATTGINWRVSPGALKPWDGK